MHRKHIDSIALLMGLACFLIVAGCGTTAPSRFYLLTAAQFPSSEPQEEAKDISLVVGPVDIPEYLDRPQIVTRRNINEIHLAEFDRWAEPLGENITRVIMENLSLELGTDRVFLYPYRGSQPADFRLVVDLVRFDPDDMGCLGLVARWTLFDGRNDETLLVRKSDITRVGVDTSDYTAIADAGSILLEQLCQEIADTILEPEINKLRDAVSCPLPLFAIPSFDFAKKQVMKQFLAFSNDGFFLQT